MANNSPQILPPAWRRWWSQESARLCQSLTSCLVLKVVPPLRSLHVQSGRSCAWRGLQVRGTLPHASLLGQPRTRLPQTPHCPFQQQVRIPEQVSVLPPEPCTHSAVRDPSSSPSSVSVLVPSLQLFPQSSCTQVMLYSALFGLGNLRLRPQESLGFRCLFHIPICAGCPQWSALHLSSLLFHHHQSHPNIFVPAHLWPLPFGDVFPHLPSASHTSLSFPPQHLLGAKHSLRTK